MTVCPRYCARPVKNWFQSKGLAITTAGRAAGAACNTKAIAERPLAGGIAPYPWMVQRASKMYVGPLTNSDISRAAQMCVDINCMGGGCIWVHSMPDVQAVLPNLRRMQPCLPLPTHPTALPHMGSPASPTSASANCAKAKSITSVIQDTGTVFFTKACKDVPLMQSRNTHCFNTGQLKHKAGVRTQVAIGCVADIQKSQGAPGLQLMQSMSPLQHSLLRNYPDQLSQARQRWKRTQWWWLLLGCLNGLQD